MCYLKIVGHFVFFILFVVSVSVSVAASVVVVAVATVVMVPLGSAAVALTVVEKVLDLKKLFDLLIADNKITVF